MAWAQAAASAVKQEAPGPVRRAERKAGRAQPTGLEPEGGGLPRLEALGLGLLLSLAGLALAELAGTLH